MIFVTVFSYPHQKLPCAQTWYSDVHCLEYSLAQLTYYWLYYHNLLNQIQMLLILILQVLCFLLISRYLQSLTCKLHAHITLAKEASLCGCKQYIAILVTHFIAWTGSQACSYITTSIFHGSCISCPLHSMQ